MNSSRLFRWAGAGALALSLLARTQAVTVAGVPAGAAPSAAAAPALPSTGTSTAAASLKPEQTGFFTEYNLDQENLKPWALAMDEQGRIWVTLDTTRELGRFDPSTGVFTRFPTPKAVPFHLVVRDGKVWYTDFSFEETERTGRLLRLDPATGVTDEFSLTDPKAGPAVLRFDPRGDLWLTEILAGRASRFDVKQGKFVQTWQPPASDEVKKRRFPYGLLFDKKGRMWVAEAGTDRVLRAGQGDEFKAFTLPEFFYGPSVMAEAPDGTLWVAGHGTSSVATLNPENGQTVLWPMRPPEGPFPVSRPADMRFGKDGHLWVLEHQGNRIARIIPAEQTITEYELPRSAEEPEWAELDAKGYLWYAARGVGRIGKFDTSAPYYAAKVTLDTAQLPLGGKVSGSMAVTPHGSLPISFSYSLEHAPSWMSATFDTAGRFTLTSNPKTAKPGEYRVLLVGRSGSVSAAVPYTVTVGQAPGGTWVLAAIAAAGAAAVALLAWILRRRTQ